MTAFAHEPSGMDEFTADDARPVVVLAREKYGARRQHWLAARRRGITATDAAAILGVDPWQSPLSLYVDKLAPSDEQDAGEAAYWGTALEHVVATEWGKRNRHVGVVLPTPGLLAHPRRLWQLATLDRYVAPARNAAPTAVLECKCTDARNSEKWPEDGAPPDRVVAQVQHQLIVTGLRVAHVAVLVGGNRYRQWSIERDDELCTEITRLEEEFRQRLTERRPPAPIGHDADDQALDQLYTADGTAAEVDPDLVARRRELFDQIKDLEAEKKTVEQALKAQLGDATEGIHPDGRPVVTWREQTRDTYTVPASTFRVLRFPKPKKETS